MQKRKYCSHSFRIAECLFIFAVLIVLLSTFSYAVKIELSDQGTSAKYDGALINGDLTVYIYEVPTGGSPIWQETFNNAVKNGSWNVMLGQNPSNPLELEFGKKYYKDYLIDGTDVDFEDNSGSLQERLEFYSPLGYINNNSLFNFSMIQSCSPGYAVRAVNEDGTVVCEELTSGAVASGWNDTGSVVQLVTSTDNVNANALFVDNTNGRVGIGTSSPSSTLHVVGGATITNGLTVSGGTVSLPNGQINNAEISELDWTKLQNYPTGCGAGKAIQAVGDTLTCIDVVESTNGITGSGTANRIAKFTGSNTIGDSGINDLSDALAITIDANENVGIGTTSPSAKLHVYNSGSGGAIFQVGTGDGGVDLTLNLGYNGYGWYWKYLGSGSGDNNELQLWSEGAGSTDQQVYGIKQSGIATFYKNVYFNGNVGIGTTSPSSKLHVVGDVTITNGLTVSSGTVSLPNGQINNAEISELDWTKLQNYPTGCGAGQAIQAVGDTLTCIDVNPTNGITGSGTANRIAKFSGSNTIGNSGINDLSDALAITIDANENVGIGTTNPSAKLDIGGGSRGHVDGTDDILVKDDAEIDGNLYVDGILYGDGSGLTNVGAASVEDIWVNESGDTMTGNLDMNSNDIENVNLLHSTKIGIASDKTTASSEIPTGYSMYVQDDIKVGGNILGYNGDVAENVFFKDDKPEPGDVVILTSNMTVKKSYKPYDTKVAGVVSTDPAYIMAIHRDGVPLALAGIVPVKVTNENGIIKVGDLLTTSSTPGYAMKCNDLEKCRGAVVGKAMEDMDVNKDKDIINMLIFPN